MVCIQDPICNLLFSVCFDNTKSVVCSNSYADGNWLYSLQLGRRTNLFNNWELGLFFRLTQKPPEHVFSVFFLDKESF